MNVAALGEGDLRIAGAPARGISEELGEGHTTLCRHVGIAARAAMRDQPMRKTGEATGIHREDGVIRRLPVDRVEHTA